MRLDVSGRRPGAASVATTLTRGEGLVPGSERLLSHAPIVNTKTVLLQAPSRWVYRNGGEASNPAMGDIYETRRLRLQEIVRDRFGGDYKKFSEFMGYKQVQFGERLVKGVKRIGEKQARAFEKRFGKPTNWMDSPDGVPSDLSVMESQLVRLFRRLSDDGRDDLITAAHAIRFRENPTELGTHNPFGVLPPRQQDELDAAARSALNPKRKKPR